MISLFVSISVFSLEVRLKDDIVLNPEQNQMLLSDFVEDADAFSLTGMGGIIFGYAPLPGKTLKIDVEYVINKFKRYLSDTDFVLPGKDVITVYRCVNVPETQRATFTEDPAKAFDERGFTTYSGEDVERLILSALEERFGIKFDDKLNVDFIDIEQDSFEGVFKQIKLYSQSRNRFMAKIDYADASDQLKYLRIVFDCSWITDIAVSTQEIKHGVLISDEYVRFEQLEYFDYDKPVRFADFPDDQITKYVIKKDDIIEWRMLARRSYVLKGQIITAVFDTGSVVVTSQVEVLSNAELGQLVKARNLDSDLTVTGIVESGPILRIGY
ncbi:MAG TPA: flagellar basal body P-ring formation chaperone FlgA [Thermotogota bacterium]|nr:flagellar basal body P-ring formation chaperone FlgA [Thermotogota bacterium]